MDTSAARRAYRSYRDTPLSVRAFVAARIVVAPLGPLGAEFEGLTGSVLSLGSGLSVVERYLAELEPDLTFEGVDLDQTKVDIIADTAARSPRVRLVYGDATVIERDQGYDVVLVCDALHHFPAERHGEVIEMVAGLLNPGGVALIKDLDDGPRWKYEWNRFHDRIVAGPEPITCRPPAEVAGLLEGAGLQVEKAERIEFALSPYAHYLVRARRPQ